MAIDLFGLDEATVRQRFPDVYGHLWREVKPERDVNNRATYRDNWWLFGEPRRELRPALTGLSRYIATVETAKHRLFQFLDATILPDNKLLCVATEDGYALGVLSSRTHICWSLRAGGWLGVGNDSVYVKSRTFDPFPFPEPNAATQSQIAKLADELDATRKAILARHDDLTLTGLYNLRAKIESGQPLAPFEQDQRIRGQIDILCALHTQLDAAVARAYGWAANLPEEEVIARLVALNHARHRAERAGTVLWLRPDFQLPRAGFEQLGARAEAAEAIGARTVPARKPVFPRDAIGQTAAVLEILRRAPSSAADIAGLFTQGRRAIPRIEATLRALGRLGHVSVGREG